MPKQNQIAAKEFAARRARRQAREKVDQARKLNAKVEAVVPMAVRSAIQSVMAASETFKANPCTETAAQYASAAERAQRRIGANELLECIQEPVSELLVALKSLQESAAEVAELFPTAEHQEEEVLNEAGQRLLGAQKEVSDALHRIKDAATAAVGGVGGAELTPPA